MARSSPKLLKAPVIGFNGLVNSKHGIKRNQLLNIKMKVWKTDAKYSKYSYNKRMTIRRITEFSTAIKARREWNKIYNEQQQQNTANIKCILRKTHLQEWDKDIFKQMRSFPTTDPHWRKFWKIYFRQRENDLRSQTRGLRWKWKWWAKIL